MATPPIPIQPIEFELQHLSYSRAATFFGVSDVRGTVETRMRGRCSLDNLRAAKEAPSWQSILQNAKFVMEGIYHEDINLHYLMSL
jgi:hypothetical protein